MSSYQLYHFDKLPSTNRYALQHLDALPHHSVILADSQTQGYGRFKRPWLSPNSNNIYMSIILKPELTEHQIRNLANLTQCMSLVICEVLERYQVSATLKWPNDVLVDSSKIAGILSETVSGNNGLKGYVLGAGINLNMQKKDCDQIVQAATSLNLIIGKEVDRDLFVRQVLDAFLKQYPYIIQNGFKALEASYLDKIHFLNHQITVNTISEKITGIATGFTSDGRLILHLNTGERITISAGDIETT